MCPPVGAWRAHYTSAVGDSRSGSPAVGRAAWSRVGVLRHVDGRREQPRLRQRVRVRCELRVHEVDELRVQRLVGADAAREVPRVHEEVGGHLGAVALRGSVPVGEMDGALQRAGLGERRAGGRRRPVPGADWIGPQLVAVERVADVGHGPAGEDRRHPQLLDDEVVDELADIPFGAGRRRVPLSGADGVHEFAESRQGAAVQRERVHVVSALSSTCRVLGCLGR